MKEFKLAIELVPATSWYNNLRNAIPKSAWDAIRKGMYAEYNYRCGICNASKVIHCHEKWEYDDEKHVQKLIGFIALCPLCHWVKHIGLAGIRGQQGQLDFEQIIQHFMKVNNCDRRAFEEHREDAFKKWKERSQHLWKVEINRIYFHSSD